MSSYSIVALPGDGIGPECLRATLVVLDAVCDCYPELKIQLQTHDSGARYYRKHGVAMEQHVLKECLQADAVLLAAIGLPEVRKPDGTEIQPEMMMGLRRALGLYAAVRPVKLYPGVRSPLNTCGDGIDMVILRENLEGLFASFGGGCQLNDLVATDTLVITRSGTERIVEYAFRLAEKRNGRPSDGKRKVTCVDKANIFRSFAFFRKVFFEVAGRYPSIESDAVYVDAMSLHMVTRPGDWDVLVMENQFGDILSDLGAAIVGGLGFAPSAEIGEKHGLFQPSHGTAPEIAGRDIANPIATILSAAMMFDWLGDRHRDPLATHVSQNIELAVNACLLEGTIRTADQGGNTSTMQVAHNVADRLVSLGKHQAP